MYRSLFLRGLLCGVLALNACAQSVRVRNSSDAATIYHAAVEDMGNGLYPEASKAFNDIRARFPYSPFAALSELRLADTHLLTGRYLEAIESFRLFLQYHARHPEAPYAEYKIAEAHMKRAPNDWWFMPPAHEKDLGAVRQAVRALGDFSAKYPKNKHIKDARKSLAEGRNSLAAHELYVARFYFRRDEWRAAMGRADKIINEFDDTKALGAAYLIAVRGALALKQGPRAREYFKQMQTKLPNAAETKTAQKLLNVESRNG